MGAVAVAKAYVADWITPAMVQTKRRAFYRALQISMQGVLDKAEHCLGA